MKTAKTTVRKSSGAALAKIHIAKQQLEMEDSDYRTLLQRVAGVNSSKDLNGLGVSQVLAEFKRLGFTEKPKKPQTRKMADFPQATMIRGLWLELHKLGYVRDPSEQALAGFVKRMTTSSAKQEVGVDALQWVTAAQASKLIEELKKWRGRDAVAIEKSVSLLAKRRGVVVDGVALLDGTVDAKEVATFAPLEQLSLAITGDATPSKANADSVKQWLKERLDVKQ